MPSASVDRISPETRVAVEAGLFIALPLLLSAGLTIGLIHGHDMAFDFGREYLPAVHRWLHGQNPYVPSHQSVAAGIAFPYTALALLMLIPLAVLPSALSGAIFVLLAAGAAVLTLWVLGARDWRLYGLLFLWPPVVTGWTTGNFTLFAILAVAVAWQYRLDHPIVAGMCLALSCSLKPFLWPIGILFLTVGSYRLVTYALGIGTIMNLAAFMVVGFDRLGAYVHDSTVVSDHFIGSSYGAGSVALHFGASRSMAWAITFASAAFVALVGVLLSRRRGRSGAPALVLATFLASPVLWMHYFALLLLPLVTMRPRVCWVWLIGLCLWACPLGSPTPLENLIAMCVVCVQMVAISSGRPDPARPTEQNAHLAARRSAFLRQLIPATSPNSTD